MNLEFTDDQAALRDAVGDFLAKEAPTSIVRAAEPHGFDEDLWRQCVEMGLPAIAVPEEEGGGGAGLLELAIVAEGVGRCLAPVPLNEVAAANWLLARCCAGDLADTLLRPSVDGAHLVTLAVQPVRGNLARAVPAGAVADVVLVCDDDDLYAVEVERHQAQPILNLGAMPLADVPIKDAQLIATGTDAVTAYRAAVGRWQALTAVSLVGLGERALEIGIDYVRERHAFGVLIGQFQTIQHHLADNATWLQGARLLAYKAAWSYDVLHEDADDLALMSLLFASDTAFRTASDSLHFHGGYGYTLEYDIQLYFRRSKAWSAIAGTRPSLYAEVGRRFAESEG